VLMLRSPGGGSCEGWYRWVRSPILEGRRSAAANVSDRRGLLGSNSREGVPMRKRTADEPLTREQHRDESDYASLGSHVASVLEAANAAAGRLHEEAAADAARIRNDAQMAADTKITEASAEASKLVEEAQRLQRDAEEAAKRTTESAEAAAVRRREDADAEAAKILELAGEVASRQQMEMVTRKKVLDESVDLAEQRLRQLLSGLRELADRLENVLSAETSQGWTDPAGETLDEALKESVRNE
jgi:hypothetical protein